MSEQAKAVNERRRFLKTSLAVGVATAASAAVARGLSAPGTGSEGSVAEPVENPGGYRLTEHVRAYYRSIRD